MAGVSLAEEFLKVAKVRGDRTLLINYGGLELTLEYSDPVIIDYLELMAGRTFEREDPSQCNSTGDGCEG